MKSVSKQHAPAWLPYVLLALANLFWAGNWVIGRGLRDSFDPVRLNFLRWLIAALLLAPFAAAALRGKGEVVRRNLWLLLTLALTGGVLFPALVYLGLESTTTVNAVLLNCSAPLFTLLFSWMIEREAASAIQIVGMLISWVGIFIILGHGEITTLLRLEFHAGDGWILLAIPNMGLYSVLLKRLPSALHGTAFICLLAGMTVSMLLPSMVADLLLIHPTMPTRVSFVGVLYIGIFSSVAAYMCWNRAVAQVGANVAGFSTPLMPAFGTVLAMVFLGERAHTFQLIGITIILSGVILATRSMGKRKF